MRDDRDEPFGDIFEEIERMMNEMMGTGTPDGDAGFSSETHVSVQHVDDDVRLVADLPGVDNSEIDIKCDGRTLTIVADSETRRYDERVRLPVRVDEYAASASFNNGILEVTFPAIESSADIDVE